MRAHATFDTLQFSKRLTDAGLQPKVSEELTDVIADLFQDNNFVTRIQSDLTKTYFDSKIDKLDNKIDSLKIDFDSKIDNLKIDFDSKIDKLDSKIDNIKIDFDSKIDNLKIDFDSKINKLDSKIDNLRVDVDSKIDKLDKKIDNLKIDLSSKINNLEGKMHAINGQTETRLVRWMVGLFITNITIISALIAVSQFLLHATK